LDIAGEVAQVLECLPSKLETPVLPKEKIHLKLFQTHHTSAIFLHCGIASMSVGKGGNDNIKMAMLSYIFYNFSPSLLLIHG
jgi:hypothetical protein